MSSRWRSPTACRSRRTSSPTRYRSCGVNDRAQLAALERIVQRRRADALMLAGTTIADPARIDIRGRLNAARDVTIDVGCVFEGRVRLADGAHVGPYCVLRDVAVGARTRSRRSRTSRGRRSARNCRIGPFARLRPGAELADDVHIGNFVEVKASTLGEGSKANHLAYVGDAASAAASTTAPARSPRTTTARTSTARSSATTCTSARTACSSRRSRSAPARRSAAAARSSRTRRRDNSRSRARRRSRSRGWKRPRKEERADKEPNHVRHRRRNVAIATSSRS